MSKDLKKSIKTVVCAIISAAMLLGALVPAYAAVSVSLADLVQAAKALRTGELSDADAMQKLDTNGNGRIELADLVTLAQQFTQGNGNHEPDTDWKEVFKQVVHDEASGYSRPLKEVRFALVDIDDNGIPELISDSDFAPAGNRVYMYTSQDSTVTVEMSHWGFSYIPGANLFCRNYGHQGMDNYTIYKIQNGEFVELARGTSNPASAPPLTFTWNGEECSEAHFNAELDKIYDRSKAEKPFETLNGTYKSGVYNWEEALQAIDAYR